MSLSSQSIVCAYWTFGNRAAKLAQKLKSEQFINESELSYNEGITSGQGGGNVIATDTKSQILSAAIDLFAQHGYEKTTTRTIAKRVGVQPASIYYFFDSKESLLRTIFEEFELNFSKYRNEPHAILKSAQEKPLYEVLSMLFYTFGSPEEHDRMMTISRVILSLQYENVGAQKLLEKVMIHDALEYGVHVLEGLHSLGVIRAVDFQWTAFIFHSFAVSVFQENLRNLMPYAESDRKFEAGVHFLCSQFAQIIKA